MISVYKININDIPPCDFRAEYQLLSQTEKDRVLAYKKPIDQKRSVATKILVRKAVKENFGIEDYVLKRNETQKPVLDFCYLSFSHSDNMAFCALSDKPVGIDAEKIRSLKKSEKYHFFTNEENIYVNSSSNTELSFLEIWTRKEALFKCSDISVSKLSSFSVITDFDEYSFKTEVLDDYIISICLKK